MPDTCFRLKGSVLTVVVLELQDYSPAEFAEQLQDKIARAPQLLQQSPLVINVDRYTGEGGIDFAALAAQCRELGVQPLGVRSNEQFDAAVRAAGLAVLPAQSARESAPRPPKAAAARATAVAAEQTPRPATRLITAPVRSGQQVYARDSDLVILSQVSEGAEVLADGNIHIYGGLRGRALAGVRGDESARIFCHNLHAELLSVAGRFLLSEDLPQALWKQSVQVFLREDKLELAPL